METFLIKLTSLITDHWFFLIFISIPFIFIKSIIKTVKLFFYLYKNNRSGINNGYSKHFADRLLEIYYSESFIQYKFSNKFNKEFIHSGSMTCTANVDIEIVDNYLIDNKLVIKKLSNQLEINTENLEAKIKNKILVKIFKFISEYIYLDKNLF